MIEVPAALTTLGIFHVNVSRGLQTMAQLTPAVAALITAGLFSGRRTIVPILLPLLKVHAPVRWYALALLVAPATQAAGLLLYRTMGHSLPEFGRWSELPMMGIVLALFSAGEELGWRGFFLPTLMKGNSLLAATGWMALFWGFWHLPFYLAANSEGQSTWLQYLLFLAGIFPVSAVFALIYSRTRSVFLCLLFHGSLNAGAAYWFGPLPAGELLPFALWTVLLWIAAIPVFCTLKSWRSSQEVCRNRRV
jgi:membrane protease YdiL (CAAX protease family)